MEPSQFLSHLPFVKSKTKSADFTLFIGAGFSISAQDSEGKNLPLGMALAKELWSLSYPDEQFDESSTLQDVYELALSLNEKKTEQFMSKRFNVLAETIPDWYATYLRFPWKKIYSLNIDNLIQKSSSKFTTSRPVNSITPFKASRTNNQDLTLDIIHLNGSLADLPKNVTFSKESYAKRGIFPDHLYSELAAELLTTPFIFIGTSADEPELWKYIELRKLEDKIRGRAEKRPRSFIVMPSLNPAKLKLLEKFNVEFLPYTAEVFADLLEKHLNTEITEGITSVKKRNNYSLRGKTEIEFVSELRSTKDMEVRVDDDFLLGGEPTWQDLQTGKVILRDQVTAWTETLIAQIESKKAPDSETKKSVFSLLATAGDGKSTIAKQIALKLDNDGYSVGWIDKESEINKHDFEKIVKNSRKMDALFIDDADMMGVELSTKLVDLYNEGIIKTALCCVRSGKVDRLLNQELLKPYLFSEFNIKKLNNAELEELLKLLDSQNRLGKLKGLSFAERKQKLIEHYNSELIVAMIEATSGMKLEEKISNEYKELEGDEKDIYCSIACTSYERHHLTREDILIMFQSFGSSETFEILDKMQRRGLIKENSRGGFTLRHRKIAEIVVNGLITEGIIQNYFSKIVNMASIRVHCNTNLAHYKKMLKIFLNHNLIHRVTSPEMGRMYYASHEQLLSDDYNFWLQYGCFEMDNSALQKARVFLNNANGVNKDHIFVVTALASLDFMDANKNPSQPAMVKLAEEALEQLKNQIRKQRDPFAYHIIGVQGGKWASRGIIPVDEKYKYLLVIKDLIEEGIRYYPNDERLEEVLKEIQRDILYLKAQ
jgi:hypothetical protein